MGIRVSRPEVARAIESMFAGHLVDDPDAPPNFSVRIGGFEGDHDPNPLHLLYRGRRQVVRSRMPSRVLAGLGAHISAVAPGEHGGHRTHALVFVGPSGRAVIADPGLHQQRAALQAALSRREIELLDEPVTWVDVAAGEVRIPPSEFPPTAAATALDDQFGGAPSSPVPAQASGPHRLAGWLVATGRGAPTAPSRSVAVAAVAEAFMPVADRSAAEDLLHQLDARVREDTIRWASSTDRAAIVDGIAALLG